MIIDITQGSEEWLDLRKTKITASDASVIMESNPYSNPQLLLRQKLNQVVERPCTCDMRRGIELEPVIRDMYCEKYGVKGKPTVHVGEEKKFGFFQLPSPESNWAMCSTDLLLDDCDVVAEFKCGRLSFKQASRGHIPDYYLCQMQHILWITGRSLCHYVAFDGEQTMLVFDVKRNDDFIQKMIEKEYEFYLRMQNAHNNNSESSAHDSTIV